LLTGLLAQRPVPIAKQWLTALGSELAPLSPRRFLHRRHPSHYHRPNPRRQSPIPSDPDRSRRIVWMVNRIIKP
jgi:hypothetical protein